MSPGKKLVAALLTVSLLSGIPENATAGEPVKLSDKTGRTLTARIILVVGDEVEIQLADGRKLTLPISKFSLSSQALIRKDGGDGIGAPAPTKPATPAAPAKPVDPSDPTTPDAPAPPANFVDDPIFAFNDLEFKDKKLDHFLVRTIDTGYDPADKYAEKVFDEMAATIPALPGLFEKQGFRAPGQDPNTHDFPEPDKQFRHEIYLVEESGDYQNMVTQYSEQYPNEQSKQNFVNSSGQIGNFADLDHRLTVIRKEAGKDSKQLVAHMVGFQLLGARIEQRNLPFWLRMGAGYYAEHKLFKKCTVYYVDFQNYYESEAGVAGDGGNMTKAEILSNSEPWTKPLKALCKKGKRVNLERLFMVTSAELTPNDSAYAMALYCFMNSSPEKTKNFNDVLDQIKDGSSPDPQDMADAFGYATPEEFQDAWYAYIESSAFR